MRILKTTPRQLSVLLSLALLLSGLVLPLPCQAQRRVIVVNADQPNIWTLEQAHYLLAQMHRRNLDLRAKRLEDLDPNEINGLRFDVMRMLLEFGATFNQADLASNRMFSENQEFNSQRRRELTAEADRLRKESLSLTGEIDDLETKKADAETEEEKAKLDAKIASKKNRLAKVDKELENTNAELKTLNVSGGELKATTGSAEFDPNKLPKSVFDKAFEAAAASQIEQFNDSPKLNATLRLDNFLQMQYEIIAKQLTLLRDEVGPGERLLFLEMPQTLNVVHREADAKWAQSWWKIAGYTRREPVVEQQQTSASTASPTPGPTASPTASQTPSTRPSPEQSPRPVATQEPDRSSTNKRPIKTSQDLSNMLGMPPAQDFAKAQSPEPKYEIKFVPLNDLKKGDPELGAELKSYVTNSKVTLSNRVVRTVELIPRQSSLNVNDMKLNIRAGAFNFVLSTLFGFGSQLKIQRQREQFSQFVQQELYSSAFGKGSREFGWTFTPMPGTDRLQSGVRTTYAVVVVPDDASSLVIEANGCYFPRTAYQPVNFADTTTPEWNDTGRTSRNCSGEQARAFIVPIPTATIAGTNDFWVNRIDYQPVGKGKQIVVLISGQNFSSQIGVLINGVPLRHSIGLAQPLIRDDSRTGRLTEEDFKDAAVQGHIERIDTNKIVFSFTMPPDFEGTPTITLVAPGKAIDLNWLTNIRINESVDRATLSEKSTGVCKTGQVPPACVEVGKPMFEGDPVNPLRIERVEAFRSFGRNMNVLITGAGFESSHRVFINGVPRTVSEVSKTLISVTNIPAPFDDDVQVTLRAGDKTLNAKAVVNPLQLKIDNVTVVSYEEASQGNPAVLVVRLEGRGFNQGLQVLPRRVRLSVTSSTEAFLTIQNPNRTEVVTLSDPITLVNVSTVIGRKPPK